MLPQASRIAALQASQLQGGIAFPTETLIELHHSTLQFAFALDEFGALVTTTNLVVLLGCLGLLVFGRPPANGALPVTNINSAWSDDEWARVARERQTSAFLTYHQRCGDAKAPLESFRLSQILSFGGLVVAEDSDGEDVALFEDIIRVEKKFYGDWSKETRQLLADGDALAAYKRRAFDLYRQRFAPEALLRRVDAWNERGAPDGWQDS